MRKKKEKTGFFFFFYMWNKTIEVVSRKHLGTDERRDSPVLLDIFLDAALRLDEREGRFAIAFRRHDDAIINNLLAREKYQIKFLFSSRNSKQTNKKTPQQMMGPPISSWKHKNHDDDTHTISSNVLTIRWRHFSLNSNVTTHQNSPLCVCVRVWRIVLTLKTSPDTMMMAFHHLYFIEN